MTYAAKSKTPIEATRNEIEKLLGKHGATAFGYIADGSTTSLAFRMAGLNYRFTTTIPDESPQAARSKWRAILLVIKARLEGVAAGIETVEDAFMSNIVTETGETVGERYRPEFVEAAKLGRMPKQLQLTGPR